MLEDSPCCGDAPAGYTKRWAMHMLSAAAMAVLQRHTRRRQSLAKRQRKRNDRHCLSPSHCGTPSKACVFGRMAAGVRERRLSPSPAALDRGRRPDDAEVAALFLKAVSVLGTESQWQRTGKGSDKLERTTVLSPDSVCRSGCRQRPWPGAPASTASRSLTRPLPSPTSCV